MKRVGDIQTRTGGAMLYGEMPGVDKKKVRDFHEKRFRALLEDKGVRPFYSETEKSCLLFRVSPWDSEIFSMKIAHIPAVRIDPSEGTAQIRGPVDRLVIDALGDEVMCVIARFSTDDPVMVPLMLEKGFSISEILVMMSMRLEKFRPPGKGSDVIVRPVASHEVPWIQDLIVDNYENHFSRDSRFPQERTHRMLGEWMKNCVHGRVDRFTVALRKDRIVGFLALKLLKEEKTIFGRPLGFVEMIVVDKKNRGRGVADALLREGVEWLSETCDEVILNVALENASAINYYAKTGFKILSSRFTFHGWMEDL